MRYLTFTFFLVCFSYLSFSQMVTVKEKTSGYLGNRFLVGLHVVGGPSLEPQKARIEEPSYRSDFELTLNRGLDLELSAVLTSRTMFVVSAFHSRTSMNVGYRSINLDGSSEPLSNYAKLKTGTPTIRDRGASLGFKMYRKRKGALAPIGSYFQLAARFHNISTDMSDMIFATSYSDGWESSDRTYKLEDPIFNVTGAEIQLGMGVTTAVRSKILVDFRVVSGYLLGAYYSDFTEDFKRQIKTDVMDRIRRKQLINISLGAAYPF
jgi:hypothetical protein